MLYFSVIVIVILAAFWTGSCAASACPAACSCNDVPNDDQLQVWTYVACSNLTYLSQLPNTTVSLKLTSIPADINLQILIDDLINVSQHLALFSTLSLSGCALENIDDVSFLGLCEYVSELDLSNNCISELPANNVYNFTNNTKLTKLDLSANRFQTIIDDTYSDFTSLKILNLSVNRLLNLSINSFNGLNQLEYLDLSSNNLTLIGGNVFSHLIQLQYLNLSNNKIETLEDNCFSQLTRLQQLDVSHNQLTSVEPSALQALPSLARLTLAGNPHLGDLLVGTGRRLQAVDASRTGLAHVPPALTRSVRTLRLAGNSIHVVRCGDLDSYPLLQLLDFAGNSLESIEEDALGRLDTLFMLYLSENSLPVIPGSLPASLKILHLERNKIEQLKVGQFNGLINLEVLLLSDNDITSLEEGTFDDLHSLVTLDISGNPLVALGGGVFSGPTRLQVLRLAGLPVATIARDTSFPVHAPEHLVSLDLTASPGLARMLLADVAALTAAKYLQELSLADAGLVHIRNDLLQYLPQLRSLRLTGNRLDCSQLLWLAEWLRQQNREDDRAILCAAPPNLAGTLLVDLQENDIPDVTEVTTISHTTTLSQFEYISPGVDHILRSKLNSSETLNDTDETISPTIKNIFMTSDSQTLPTELESSTVSTSTEISKNDYTFSLPIEKLFSRQNNRTATNNNSKSKTTPAKIDNQVEKNNVTFGTNASKYSVVNRSFYANDSTSAKILRDLFITYDSNSYSNPNGNGKSTVETVRIKENKHPSEQKTRVGNERLLNRTNMKNLENASTNIHTDETPIQLKIVSEPKFILSPVVDIKDSASSSNDNKMNILDTNSIEETITAAMIVGGSDIKQGDRNSTEALSMYRRTSGLKAEFSEHPGLLVLVVGMLGAILTVVLTVTKWSSCRRRHFFSGAISSSAIDNDIDNECDLRHHRGDSIEVNHLPGVTDLW